MGRGGKSSRGKGCLKRGKPNRDRQPHDKLPLDCDPHRYFLSGCNEYLPVRRRVGS
jgi:hypothetical protein